mgnify:CR=1 FL=1
MERGLAAITLEDGVDLGAAQGIAMFQHGAGAGGLPDLPRAFGRQRGEMIGDDAL